MLGRLVARVKCQSGAGGKISLMEDTAVQSGWYRG